MAFYAGEEPVILGRQSPLARGKGDQFLFKEVFHSSRTQPRTPNPRNQSQRTRRFLPADRAWGHQPADVLKEFHSVALGAAPASRCSCGQSYFTRLSRTLSARHHERTQQIGADGNGPDGDRHKRAKDLTTKFRRPRGNRSPLPQQTENTPPNKTRKRLTHGQRRQIKRRRESCQRTQGREKRRNGLPQTT